MMPTNHSNNSLENTYEEEMVRLAEEMSLLDEYKLSWDPRNLDDTKNRLQIYEEIVDGHLGIHDGVLQDFNSSSPISEMQIREIFGQYPGEASAALGGDERVSTTSLSSFSHHTSDLGGALDAPHPHQPMERRATTRGREQMIQETVHSICRSLRWYQNKIVKEIQASQEEDGNLANLLELNDRVSSVLTKADFLTSNELAQQQELATSNSQHNAVSLLSTSASFDRLSPSNKSPLSRLDSGAASKSTKYFPAIMAAIYTIRRGGGRDETANAVENLIKLCNFGGEVRQAAVRQMTSAGALQALLSALTRAAEWPEVELQISKVISVLVTYEEDWALLQRSALIILSQLYTLQLKTQSRARTVSEAPPMVQQAHCEHDGDLSRKPSLSIMVPPVQPELPIEDIRVLVSAAIAKISLVLTVSWGKQESPFGDFTGFAGFPSSSVPSMYGLDRNEKRMSGNYASRLNKAKKPVNESAMEAQRILQILLHLISTVCETTWNSFKSAEGTEPFSISKFQAQSYSFFNNGPPSVREGRDRTFSVENNSFFREVREGSRTISASDIDHFLKYMFDIHFDSLLMGESLHTKSLLIDNSAVLCAFSLLTLAEIPQCRPGLVAGGALRMIKYWLEIGISIMENMLAICKDHLGAVVNHSHFQESFFTLFGPSYELIGNAAAALMLVAGGSDSIYNSNNSNSSSFDNTQQDYTVGWIDAQILAEGLPEIIVRLIAVSHESFTKVDNSKIPTISVMPANIRMHLAQTLFQLCSRPQNRQRLQGTSIPYALCLVFETSLGQLKLIIEESEEDDVNYNGDSEYNALVYCSLFRRIFEYGKLPQASAEWNFGEDAPSLHYNFHMDDKTNAFSPLNNTLNNSSIKPPLKRGSAKSQAKSLELKMVPPALLACIYCIVTSCLDTVTHYFLDEASTLVYANSQSSASANAGIPVMLPSFQLSTPHPNASSNDGSIAPNVPLIDLICNPRIIASLLLTTSKLPKGSGRMAAIRFIASLSDVPESLSALYEGSVMFALMLISSEVDEMHTMKSTSTRSAAAPFADDNSVHSHNKGFIPKPNNAERNTSNGSSISGISSSCNSTSKGLRSRSQSLQKLDMFGRGTPNGNQGPLTYEIDEEDLRNADLALEETILVCKSLADLCEADKAHSLRMYNSGLFEIMTKLVRGSNVDIVRQALRCLLAICKAIDLGSGHEEPDKVSTKGKQSSKTISFADLLEALSETVKSENDAVQLGSISTIAQLARLNDEMKDKIVTDSLRSIISILVNPKNSRELKWACEEVLRNIGFSGGMKDFEICGFDFEILRDWYAMQRSLKPQEVAMQVLREWIFRLFLDDDETNPQLLLNYVYENGEGSQDLIHEAENILHINVSTNHMPVYLRRAADHQVPMNHSHPLSVSIPNLHRQFTEYLRNLPFCLSRPTLNEHQSDETENRGSIGGTPGRDSFGGGFNQQMNRSNSAIQPPAATVNFHSLPASEQPYTWIDRPPMIITHLLDLFYSSKIHQLLLMDLTSLGIGLSVSIGENELVYAVDDTDNAERLKYAEFAYLIPEPHPVQAILFPSRTYQTFARVGRVLQKMFEYADVSKLWSLSFRDSEYMGDFHTTLLSTLQRCPQICSLSFSSPHRVEDDALLGHLVGQIPSTVRFVSFKGTLSGASVQALCILLRTQNAAFISPMEYDDPSGRSYKFGALNGKTYSTPSSSEKGKNGKDENYPEASKQASKGLLGLALTYLNLDASEINHIIELLHPKAMSRSQSYKNRTPSTTPMADRSSKKDSAFVSTPGSATKSSPFRTETLRGLRYLDLSHNKLHDAQCAQVLTASIQGPLEGLELGGNFINKGVKFTEALGDLSSDRHFSSTNRLRYLGLSQNELPMRTVTGFLKKLYENTSLTSLDLSDNSLENTNHLNQSLRAFLQHNTGLRILDLSYNKLSADSYKEIYLGILENHTMLMLPLAGNYKIDFAPSIELIQLKLRNNRLLYKAQSRGYTESFLRGEAIFHTEDISSRISFNHMTPPGESSMSRLSEADIPMAHVQSVALSEDSRDTAGADSASVDTKKSSLTLQTDFIGDAKCEESDGRSLYLSPDAPERTPSEALAIAIPIRATSAPNSLALTQPLLSPLLDHGSHNSNSNNSAANNKESSSQDHSKDHADKALLPHSNTSNSSNTLNVLFSSPLAGFDKNAKAHPLEVLDYTSERDTLIQVFKEVHRDVSVHFDFATTDSLRTILSFGCKALHFSGHGIPKGLCFEDGRSGLQVIPVPQLRDLLGAGGLALEFVFVSACYSKEIGEAFVDAGVAHVVCVKVESKIQDAAAIAFTRAFYVAFLSGRTVQASFNIAKEALKASPYVPDSVLEGEKFILLPDLSPNKENATGDLLPPPFPANHHERVIFTNRPVTEWPAHGQCTIGPNRTEVSLFISRNRLPSPPTDFEGREVIMNNVIRSLFERRLVSLVGEDGVGKSAVAAAVCKYIADREVFRDGIVYQRVKGVKDFRTFITGVQNAILNSGNNAVARKMRELMASRRSSDADQHNVIEDEEIIFACLEPLKLLLVFDHLDDLLADYGEAVTDFRLFLSRLFEQCGNIKVLSVATDTLSMHYINFGYGIVEYSVMLGPLTLNSTLRLFARLAPSLTTSHEKAEFLEALQPPKQLHVSVHSRDINNTALQILSLFGEGHPAKIVHMACESTAESVEELKQIGLRLNRGHLPVAEIHA